MDYTNRKNKLKMKINALVLTGSRKQYDYFIRSNNLNPAEFPMLKTMKQYLSYDNPLIIRVGTFYLNPLHKKIKD